MWLEFKCFFPTLRNNNNYEEMWQPGSCYSCSNYCGVWFSCKYCCIYNTTNFEEKNLVST